MHKYKVNDFIVVLGWDVGYGKPCKNKDLFSRYAFFAKILSVNNSVIEVHWFGLKNYLKDKIIVNYNDDDYVCYGKNGKNEFEKQPWLVSASIYSEEKFNNLCDVWKIMAA